MSEGKRGEALEWFNDARVSIAGKVAAIRQFHSEVSDSVFDVLDQLDRWWNRWEGSVIREHLCDHRGEDLSADYGSIVIDANDDPPRKPPPIVAVTRVHGDPAGRFRLPAVLAVYLELKAQETAK
jgi:hypothetical protein